MNAQVQQQGALAWFLECAPILRAVRQHQHRDMGRFGKVFMVLGLLGCAIGTTAGVVALARTELGLTGAMTLIGGGLLAAFATGALLSVIGIGGLQNTPANAVLVPRLNRLVRRTVVLVWLLAMAAFALFSVVIPHGVLIPLAAHLLLLSVLSLRAYSGLAFMLLFPVQALVARVDAYAFLETPAVLALCYTAAMLLGWRMLVKAFPLGGESHFAYSTKARKSDVAAGTLTDWARMERNKNRLRPLYARLLAADVKRRRPVRLLMHVFGPDCQRFDYLVIWLGYAALCVLTWLAVRAWWPQYYDSVAGMAMLPGAAGFAGMAIFSGFRFTLNTSTTAGEQALFRLTPAAPRAMQINHLLARTVLRVCLFEWAGSLLLMLGVAALWGAPDKILLGLFTLMCGVLMFAGWPLRDHARDPRTRYWLAVVLAMLAAAVGVMVFVTVGQYWLWMVLLALSVLVIARRYRAMLAAPPAFPARRLADQ